MLGNFWDEWNVEEDLNSKQVKQEFVFVAKQKKISGAEIPVK